MVAGSTPESRAKCCSCHESLKAKDEAEAAKDEAKKAVSDMEQHMARWRRKRKHYHSMPKVGRGRSPGRSASNQGRVPLQSVRREREASPIGSDSGQNGTAVETAPAPSATTVEKKDEEEQPSGTSASEDATASPSCVVFWQQFKVFEL